MKIKITLHDFESIRKFIQKVVLFESDVNIIKGATVFDAKSVMSLFALGSLNEVFTEIISDNEEEISRFNRDMEEFKA